MLNQEKTRRRGQWIWTQPLKEWLGEAPGQRRAYARRTFTVHGPKARLEVHVSASSRYRLYVNGHSVGTGPLKGDRSVQYYEHYDLSAWLRPGDNVIAAQIVYYPYAAWTPETSGPLAAVARPVAGFWLEGTLIDEGGHHVLDSGEDWKIWPDTAVTPEPRTWGRWLGRTMERVEGSRLPAGFHTVEFDDVAWPAAIPMAPAVSAATMYAIEQPLWDLTPHGLPPCYERPRTLRLLGENGEMPTVFGSPGRYTLIFDAGELTTGYVELEVEAKAGVQDLPHVQVSMTYAESFQHLDPLSGRYHKGVRDDASGVIVGDRDVYMPAAGHQQYEPFDFRTFRYIQLEVEVESGVLVLHRLGFRETGYPLAAGSEFNASDPVFDAIWRVSLTTLQRSMHETYEDCPYYEQLQYGLDARLESLFTYYVSADDRLARQAMHDFHASLLPMGLVQSRAPSEVGQVIPAFALQWIFMLDDHWRFFADPALVKRYRPTIDAVLDWFDRNRDASGLVFAPGYWPFIDWVDGWRAGVPDAAWVEPLTTLNAMYAAALGRAAGLMAATGREEVAREYRTRHGEITALIRDRCWDAERGYFREGPTTAQFSQHAQAWAVLAEVPLDVRPNAFLLRAVSDPALSQSSYPALFAVQQALSQAGAGEAFTRFWPYWRDMLALHLTTWQEGPVEQRSDCHGWGALPLYVFLAHILGVRPAAPGFQRLLIAPEQHGLQHARGRVVTPQGAVTVRWEVSPEGRWDVDAEVPVGLPTTVRLPTGGVREYPAGGRLRISEA